MERIVVIGDGSEESRRFTRLLDSVAEQVVGCFQTYPGMVAVPVAVPSAHARELRSS
jgi:hypothetical protein